MLVVFIFVVDLDVMGLMKEMVNVFFYENIDEIVWFYDEWVKLMDKEGNFNKLNILVYNLLFYVKLCFGVFLDVMYGIVYKMEEEGVMLN